MLTLAFGLQEYSNDPRMASKMKVPKDIVGLRIFRTIFRISLRDAAEAYEPRGCRPEFLSNVLNGRKKASRQVLEKIRRAFAKVVRDKELGGIARA